MPETPEEPISAPIPVNIEDEMRRSFLDYSMSVIISRALPDVRDGLKPSQRRILVTFNDLNLASGRPYRKCAKISGDVSGNYHPHGEAVIYPAIVRLAQPFALRYPLVDGQGNFGSIDGDPPAAMRYTEARLTRIASEVLADLGRDTVDFVPNYDNTRTEPVVLPARIPNLVINGSAGIAVGMATNIPPHNLGEVVDALVMLARNPESTIEDVMEKLPGPDFPTGATICGSDGIRQAYRTGRGLLLVRARASLETLRGDRRAITVSEIPYMVNKASLVEKIAELVRDGRIDGISDLRDESDRHGMRIVIELKKDANEEVVLNQLYKLSPMQTTFGVNLLALVNNRPRTLSILELLTHFLDFRREVVRRRAAHDLRQAEDRAHVLEGFAKALENLDQVIALIRASDSPALARVGLMEQFELSERQAQSILELRLQRLTAMERQKILDDLAEVRARIEQLRDLLASEDKVTDVIVEETEELRSKYGDSRRTELGEAVEDFTTEDLIPEEDMVVTITHRGYAKRNIPSLYRAQRRGGKGKTGIGTSEEDFVTRLFVASTHSWILFFTNRGRVHWLKVFELPQLGRGARGKALVNLLSLVPDERVSAVLPVRSYEEGGYVVLSTKRGLIKKTALDAYSNPRRGGIIAINVREGDELIGATRSNGQGDILVVTHRGKSIRFNESQVRPMGRGAAGVRGISTPGDDFAVGMELLQPGHTILTVTENGFGKRSPLEEYREQHRGGQGIITIKTTARNGPVVGILQVSHEDEIMLITSAGKILRMHVKGIPTMGRNTQGVRLMEPGEDEKVVSIARLADRDEESEATVEAPAPADG
ncbi:MAG: DNA gyrase subunit A [Deltaproteobacteria bacterium]|nr:MAG: DNA gyrase subunit A [Deltaproteobacteria bacterium]